MDSAFEHAVVGVHLNTQWVGTAFFVTPTILLTAGHVVADLKPNTVVTIRPSFQNKQLAVRVANVVKPSRSNGFLDYALLELDGALVPRHYLDIRDTKHRRGDTFPIVVAGFREGDQSIPDLESMTGVVVGSQNENPAKETAWSWTLKLNFEAPPGFSGAPLLDHQGRVFGILASRVTDSQGQKRKTIGVPIRRIIEDNEIVEGAVQDQQFGPCKHPKKQRGQRIQHITRSSIDLVRILWTARPFDTEEPGRKIARTIQNRLEQEIETVRRVMQIESATLRNGGRPILWRVVIRDITSDDTWHTYFGPDSTSAISDVDMPLLRILVDSQTSLPRTCWKDVPLDHSQISHGILLRVDGVGESEQVNHHATVSIRGDDEEAITEAVARIVDAFLDINLFHRFHHLDEMFPTAALKARFDSLKQDYVEQYPAKVTRPLSIASLARKSWNSPPEGGALITRWTEFVKKHVLSAGSQRNAESRTSGPDQTSPDSTPRLRSALSAQQRDSLIRTIAGLVGSHSDLGSRISLRTIRMAVRRFRPLNRDGFVIFAVIVDKPDTHSRRRELMKLFQMPVWKMQGASARIFEMTDRAALNSLARHVAVFVISTNIEA